MDSKQKLIEFMKQKAKILYDNDYDPNREYFTEQDEQAILNWENKDCDTVWNSLLTNIITYNNQDLNAYSCVFCIKYKMECYYTCDLCKYGKNHGICTNSADSTYQKIVQKRHSGRKSFSEILSNKVYKEILDKIEKGDTNSEGLSKNELKDILLSIKHRMDKTTFKCIQNSYQSKEQFESIYICIIQTLNYLDKE
ncbi:MAG: hypothetical protein WC438_05695 [Candidatus Pacearchaeota archaeon]